MDAFLVSRFGSSHVFVIEMPNPDLYRSDFDLITSTPGSNDPIGMFQWVSTWLCNSCVSQVSFFNFCHLTDFSRYEFDSSVSLLTVKTMSNSRHLSGQKTG